MKHVNLIITYLIISLSIYVNETYSYPKHSIDSLRLPLVNNGHTKKTQHISIDQYEFAIDIEFYNKMSPADREMLQMIMSEDLGDYNSLKKLTDNSNGRIYVRFDERSMVEEGRTVYLHLLHPIDIEDKQIRHLRIKGMRLRYDNNGNAIPYRGKYFVPQPLTVNIDGNIILGPVPSDPHGGMFAYLADREYAIMQVAISSIPFCTDYPVGKGIIMHKKYMSESLGFVVSGMECLDTRLAFRANVHDGIRHVVLLDFKKNTYKVLDYEQEATIYRLVGLTFRAYHDSGLFHRYPHPENIGVVLQDNEIKIILRDLDSTVVRQFFLGGLDQRRRQEVTYRFLDLFRLMYDLFYQEVIEVVDPNEGTVEHIVASAKRLIPSLLQGYFYDIDQEDDSFKAMVEQVQRFSFNLEMNRRIENLLERKQSNISLNKEDPKFGSILNYLYGTTDYALSLNKKADSSLHNILHETAESKQNWMAV